MERRNFLRGVISTIAASSLVVAAKPEEIAAFGKAVDSEAPVMLNAFKRRRPSANDPSDPYLYNAKGEPMAYIREVSIYNDFYDTVTHGSFDGARNFLRIQTGVRGELRADLLAPFIFGQYGDL